MISLPAHKAAAESVDSVNDDGQTAAACAYIATAEGTAATMAERACDRAGIDFAACPREVLEAADRRAEELARAFLVDQVAVIRAAWVAYETAAAPFEAEIASLHKQIAAARKAREPHQGLVNAVDHLDLMRSDFASKRNRATDAAEDVLQARFGYADWPGRDNGEFPRNWKP